ncbi:MAG: PorV/PorQ family protein [Elusimicrobiota bacterium]
MDRQKACGLAPRTASLRPAAVLAALVFLFPAGASALQTDATTSAAFLKLPIGARNAAMGATGAAEASVYSTYWNPAGLASLEGRELAYSYASWLADTSYQFLAYAQKTEVGSLGVSFQYVSIPAIQKYDNTGAPLNAQYSPLDALATVSYAHKIEWLSVGGSLKGVYSKLDDQSAQTLAADVGARAEYGKLAGGLVVQNMGPGLKFIADRAPLPLNVKAGAAFKPVKGATLTLDFNKARGSDPWIGAGAEYMLSAGGGAWVGPRIGYESDRGDLGAMAGLTFGAGLIVNKFSFDYAFVPVGEFGDTHRLSLKVRF